MVSKEELCGIIDALGALTLDEVYHTIKELSLLRGDTPPVMLSIKELCEDSEKEHLIVAVSMVEIEGSDGSDTTTTTTTNNNNNSNAAAKNSYVSEDESLLYYISGPNAFPEVPFDLSEVIDILELKKREVNLKSVADRLKRNLYRRIKNLENKIESVSESKVLPHDLENVEYRYSDILNQYYDYTFWLPDDMSGLEEEIQELSSRIESLKAAQGI